MDHFQIGYWMVSDRNHPDNVKQVHNVSSKYKQIKTKCGDSDSNGGYKPGDISCVIYRAAGFVRRLMRAGSTGRLHALAD
jgi:hypothetical protein